MVVAAVASYSSLMQVQQQAADRQWCSRVGYGVAMPLGGLLMVGCVDVCQHSERSGAS